MIRAGSLNKRVTIRQKTGARDSAGQLLETGADVCTVWADVRHPAGMQVIQAGAEVSIVRASIRIRDRSDVDASMQALFAGNTYDIKAVVPAETGYLDLVCERAQ